MQTYLLGIVATAVADLRLITASRMLEEVPEWGSLYYFGPQRPEPEPGDGRSLESARAAANEFRD